MLPCRLCIGHASRYGQALLGFVLSVSLPASPNFPHSSPYGSQSTLVMESWHSETELQAAELSAVLKSWFWEQRGHEWVA